MALLLFGFEVGFFLNIEMKMFHKHSVWFFGKSRQIYFTGHAHTYTYWLVKNNPESTFLQFVPGKLFYPFKSCLAQTFP